MAFPVRVGDYYQWDGGNTYQVTGRGSIDNTITVANISNSYENPNYHITSLRGALKANVARRVREGYGEVLGHIEGYELPKNETTHTVHCGNCSAAWPEFAGEVPRSTCMACGRAL